MSSKVINTILNLKDNFSKTLKGVANNTKTFQKQLREASSAANKMQNSFNNAFSGLKTAATVAGVGSLTAIATSSVKTYATFEQSMSKVQALSGATGEDLRQLTEKAKEMGSKTSKSASESADALGYMALAGWNTKQMLTGIEPILRASEAGEMDLATCSDLVTDSMSAMGIQVEDLNHYLDVCSKTQASSNTSMQGLLEAYVLCGGTMKNLNVSVEESATVLGTLANRGKKGAEAGNALNSILVNLTGGSSTAKGAMSELGVSAWDSQGKFIGLKATLVKLRDALSKCTDEQKTNFESAIGGKTQLDTLQAMISGVSEEYDDLNAKLNDCDGYMTQAAKTMQDNLIGKLTALKSAFEGVQIQIGERLEPVLSSVIENVTSALPNIGDKVGNILDIGMSKLPTILNYLKNLIPILLGIVAGMKSFVVITTILSIYRKLELATKSATLAQVILNATMLNNPIMLVSVALGALVAAFAYAYQHSEKFRNTFNNLCKSLADNKQIIAIIAGALTGLLSIKLLSPFSAGINALGSSFGKSLIHMLSFKNILGSLKAVPLKLISPFKILGNGIKSLHRSFILMKAFLPTLLSGGFSKIGTIFTSLLHPITLLKNGFTLIKVALMSVVSPFGIVVAAISLLVAGFIYCWNTNSQFRDNMINAWNSISTAISSIVTIVVGWITQLAGILINFYTSHQSQISSILSSVMNSVGVAIQMIVSVIQGLVEIISGIITMIDGVIQGNWSQVWEGFKSIVSSAIETIKGLWNGLVSLLSTPINAAINITKNIFGGDDSSAPDQNALGTNNFGSGYTWVGEHGPELMKLPQGTQIKTNNESKNMVNNNNSSPIQVIIQGNVIGNESFADYIGEVIFNKIQLAAANME